MEIESITAWVPVMSLGASVLVAMVALGGVIWTSARADARERKKHQREQLVSATSDLLGVAEDTMRQAAIVNDHAIDHQSKTGSGPMPANPGDRIAAEFEPAFNEFTALLIKGSTARFRIELIEPRLTKEADVLFACCIKMCSAATHLRSREVLSLRDEQLAASRGLIAAYRALD
ncbi:MAG: hypothetical protein H6523_12830 [Mycolicibacterium sp.]|nr:hypothetical protein [Mycolicibacterium sp.]